MARERCDYCGRYMAFEDYGADYGCEWVCSRQADHILADPEHWTLSDGTPAHRLSTEQLLTRLGTESPDQTIGGR